VPLTKPKDTTESLIIFHASVAWLKMGGLLLSMPYAHYKNL